MSVRFGRPKRIHTGGLANTPQFLRNDLDVKVDDGNSLPDSVGGSE